VSLLRHIVVLALRRSGTTTLWRILRQDPAYTCYDEPFSVRLRELPREHRKEVRREFIDLFRSDPVAFRRVYAPIPRGEETTVGLSPAQRAYLGFLLAQGPVVVDVTRCHGKMADVHAEAPEAVLVHLFRRPASFVTSHLVPSEGHDPFGLRRLWARRSFFGQGSRFNRWGMEELLRHPFHGVTRQLLRHVGVELPPPDASAVALLLAHWLGCFRLAERDGVSHFGERFVSLPFETFCRDPAAVLRQIRQLAGGGSYPFDCSTVRAPHGPFAPTDPRWRTTARDVGFSEAELARFF
jgi:hypothetical protein